MVRKGDMTLIVGSTYADEDAEGIHAKSETERVHCVFRPGHTRAASCGGMWSSLVLFRIIEDVVGILNEHKAFGGACIGV